MTTERDRPQPRFDRDAPRSFDRDKPRFDKDGPRSFDRDKPRFDKDGKSTTKTYQRETNTWK